MSTLLSEPSSRLLLQLAVTVTLCKLVGMAARRVGQPAVIAEITAGIMLGPSLFGAFAPSAQGLLYPVESWSLLDSLSQLGVVLFMLLIGLEFDTNLLRGRARASLVISLVSIAAPFVLGLGLAFFLRDRLAEPGVPFEAFALFMGTALSITAFPVLARILQEEQIMDTPVGALSLTSAAINDLMAWCILAFLVACTRADGWSAAVLTTLLSAIYAAAMIGLVRPLLSRAYSRWRGEADSQAWLAAILVMGFSSSLATEAIGIHKLFGAFLFGTVVPKRALSQRVGAKLEALVVVVLLPLFFTYSGLRTSLGLLSVSDWLSCLSIIAAATLGKYGASTLGSRLSGLSWRESSAVGILMNTRGMVELVVLNVGRDLGIIGPKLFSMMVVMTLVTTYATTPLLRLFYPSLQRRTSPRKELAGEPMEVSAGATPAGMGSAMAQSLSESR